MVFSYRTPQLALMENHRQMGQILVAVKNRGCGAFHLYMDEFCGGKITISIQWDHRKAESEEDSSGPVNSSQIAKIPSLRRDTHSAEQQDNPT
ncbi:hypothetical protein Tco_0890111 [Tanacetum coccineum]